MRRFHVKVCGISRARDAVLAAQLGADMIGMIFYKDSPRCITLKDAREVVRHLPPTIDRVGVFVNEQATTVLKVARHLNLDYIQLHGDETSKMVHLLQRNGYRIIKAFHVKSKGDYKKLSASKADLVMLDNVAADQKGGTGQRFDWRLIPSTRIPNLVLAGGITVDNVEQGISTFQPLVIDVNSGVESRPGIKSRVKLKRFFRKCNELRYDARR